ncbi:MAG: hypothetical protein ACRDYF_06245, partial [Acidimicrobiia bacterium]
SGTGEQCSLPKSTSWMSETTVSTRKEIVMAVTAVPQQMIDLFGSDNDDFDEAGTLGLHLGLLRRFARLGDPEYARSFRPAPGEVDVCPAALRSSSVTGN